MLNGFFFVCYMAMGKVTRSIDVVEPIIVFIMCVIIFHNTWVWMRISDKNLSIIYHSMPKKPNSESYLRYFSKKVCLFQVVSIQMDLESIIHCKNRYLSLTFFFFVQTLYKYTFKLKSAYNTMENEIRKCLCKYFFMIHSLFWERYWYGI